MFKKILVPLDGSQTAESVLPVVIEEAKSHHSTVVLLRAIAPLRQSLMSSPGSIQQALEEVSLIAQHYLEGIAEQLHAEGIKTEMIVTHGHPAQMAIETAEEKECDLIVIGTHGETGAYQWRFGSVANKIVKTKTSMPVLVVTT
jgi:nucleotide-binding universal stress UspA family protein